MDNNLGRKTMVVAITAIFIVGAFIPSINNLHFERTEVLEGESNLSPLGDYSIWWNKNWSYRKAITINYTKVDGTLNNFPVLIRLISDSNLSSHVQPNGNDIVFTDKNRNKLHHEIELFNGTNGELIAWVNVTSLSSSSDTVLWLYYGNGTCSNQENVEGTWDSNFLGVYHMNGINDYGNITDSTSNANDAVSQAGDPSYQQLGKVGYAVDFNGPGTEDSIVLPPIFTSEGAFTMEAWAYPEDGANYILCRGAASGPNANMIQKGLGTYLAGWVNNTNIGVSWDATNYSWHYFSLTYNGTNAEIWRNDTLEGSKDVNTPNWETHNTYISDRIDKFREFHGSIDEVRFSSVARNSSWVKTSFNTMNSPSSFFGIGSEESYVVFEKPVVSDLFPVDESINVPLSLSELSFNLTDYQGDEMDYIVTTVPDIGDGFGVGVGNDTYTVSVSDLDYDTVYTWYVNVTDPNGGGNWVYETFRFTTEINMSVIVSNENPTNGSINVMLNPLLSADIFDGNGESVDWEIRSNATSSWVTLNFSTIPDGDGTVSALAIGMDDYGVTYFWSVNCTDPLGSGEWTNVTFSFTTISFDSLPPSINNNFAGNPGDLGGPYFIPEADSPAADGYYANDSFQQEDWIYINCTVDDNDVGVDEVWLHWLNGTTWINSSYQFVHVGGDYYEFNSSGVITDIASGFMYSFDVWANDTNGNSVVYSWTKRGADNSTGNRIYVQLDGTPNDVSFTPFYLYPAEYSSGTYGEGYGPGHSIYNDDILHHDQGPDGTLTDTGYLLADIPTDIVEERFCSLYTGYWFDETVTPIPDTLDNIYFHNWWYTDDDAISFGYGNTRAGLHRNDDRSRTIR